MSNDITNSMMLVLALYRYKNNNNEGKLRNLLVRIMFGTLIVKYKHPYLDHRQGTIIPTTQRSPLDFGFRCHHKL